MVTTEHNFDSLVLRSEQTIFTNMSAICYSILESSQQTESTADILHEKYE